MKHIKTFRKLFENIENVANWEFYDIIEKALASGEFEQLKKLGWFELFYYSGYIELKNYYLQNPKDVNFPIFRIYMSTDKDELSESTYKLVIKTSKNSNFRAIKINKDSSNILPVNKNIDPSDPDKFILPLTSTTLPYYNDYISKIKGLINFTKSPEFDEIIKIINLENNMPYILRGLGMTPEEFDNPGSVDLSSKIKNLTDRLDGDFDFLKTNQDIDHEKLEDILDLLKITKPLSNSQINELIDIALENKDYDRIEILKKYLK